MSTPLPTMPSNTMMAAALIGRTLPPLFVAMALSRLSMKKHLIIRASAITGAGYESLKKWMRF
ncbi:MAG: hypothetical protein N2Z59_00785 [Alteraurantiacibacter sp.]|nr:hypothetical protein [Alteraurantiacibacter sp.]